MTTEKTPEQQAAYERRKARMRERYATEPEFREKQKAASQAWAKANRGRRKAQHDAWKVANPEKWLEYMRKHNRKRAGIIDATGEARTGPCPICKVEGALVCDHWHNGPKAGQIRGWICDRCNVGLGCFRDSREAALAAAEYLRG